MMEHNNSPLRGRPVVYGEVLFDAFPDGRDILGGAPFNVARHLQGFGLDPLFISRVGEDSRGEQVLAAMREWDMDTSGVQRDRAHPTGTVRIAMQGTQHTFDILPDQAYDHIDSEQALALLAAESPSLLYFGSLIERQPVSRNTLKQLRQQGVALFSDINLRAPWWSVEGATALLQGVRWVKLNDEELAALGYEGEPAEAAQRMRERFGFELLVVTCGEAGALFVTEQGVLRGEPVRVESLVDTVGAGDAFSSVVLLGLMRGWAAAQTLQRALAFAAHLCEVRGAVLPDRHYYQTCLSQWENGE